MSKLREAALWHHEPDGVVRCDLCAHACRLTEDGAWGLCGVRVVKDGRLMTGVYGRLVALHDDPIEKKPLYHFFPGSRSLSVATLGCNFRCHFCQNAAISQRRRKPASGEPVSPDEIVALAAERGCRSVAFTYTEPTVFFEYARDTAALAHAHGVKTVFVTNGFLSAAALDAIAPVLDAANVDLKAFSDDTYRHVLGGRLPPVLDTLVRMRERGIWIEVTTLVVPGLNDGDEELTAIAAFIADQLGPDTPWHVSRFHPSHEMTDRGPTPAGTLEKALAAGHRAGLRHVYAGNVPGHRAQNTVCAGCGTLLIQRGGYDVTGPGLPNGRCPTCAQPLAGRFVPQG